MNPARPSWSNQTKLIVTLVLLVLLAIIIHRFGAIMTPLILAAILAYVLTPAVNYLQNHLHFHRVAAILLTYLLLILIIGTSLMLIIPPLLMQTKDIAVDLQDILGQAKVFLSGQISIAGTVVDGRSILQSLNGFSISFWEPAFGGTLRMLANILTSLAWLVFIVVISIYLIKDTAGLMAWLEKLPPPAYRQDYIRLRSEISIIWSSFFRSQLMLALVVSLIISTVSFSLGLRFALLMGVLAGILEFLPSIGHTIWLITALIVAFFGGSTWIPLPNWSFTLLILGMHLVFQQFDINYLIPRIVGRSVRLPPLVVILGILAGASLAGVLGVALAAPTIASLRVLGRYIYAQLVDVEPFSQEIASPLPPPNPLWWRKRTEKVPKSMD